MRPSKTESNELKRLCTALGHRDPDIRHQARMEARDLSAERIEALIRFAIHRHKRALPQRLAALVAGLTLLTYLLSSCSEAQRAGILFLSTILALVVTLVWESSSPSLHFQQESLLEVLETAPDKRCVDTVIWLLEESAGNRRSRLGEILMHRLPQLRADDVIEWTSRQKPAINRLLNAWYVDEDLACCILNTLPEIGGVWILGAFDGLSKLKSKPIPEAYKRFCVFRKNMDDLAGRNVDRAMHWTVREYEAEIDAQRLRIGEAAEACLPRLQARIQEEEAASVLLRASALENTSEHLLRPAGGAASAFDTRDLLRADTQPAPSAAEVIEIHHSQQR